MSQQHAGLGLAAVAVVLGRVRAEEHRVDAPALRLQQLVHVVCTALTAAMSIMPRPMPDWLVATTACQPAWFSRATASSAPGIGTHSSGAVDMVLAELVEDAVAAEDDELGGVGGGHGAGRPTPDCVSQQAARRDRSATRFIARCRPPAAPAGWLRSAGSSALTITVSKKASTGAFSPARACSEAV
jgi:hypothetical protein